ncbi:hypothetical protein GCM10027440_06900 [Nocardiopsis coralliicola]
MNATTAANAVAYTESGWRQGLGGGSASIPAAPAPAPALPSGGGPVCGSADVDMGKRNLR